MSISIESHPTKDGGWYLTLNGSPLSTRYSPKKEAQRILEPFLKDRQELVILLGAGNPALVRQCQKELAFSALVIIDEHRQIFQTLLAPPFSYRFDRTTLIAGPQWRGELKTFFASFKSKSLRLLVNRRQWELNPSFYDAVRQEIIDLHDKKSINIATLSRFEKLWLKNITKNTEVIISAYGVKQLSNAFLQRPALIIGAGPSLAAQLELIKAWREKVVLIAVDTVYKALLRNDIHPHFVVIVDPQKINSKYVEGIDKEHLERSYFVAEPAVCPKSIRDKTGRLFLFNTIFPYFKCICQYFGDKGNIDMGGSVATTAFDLAISLGFSKVALVGLDLSYSQDRYHLPGTMYEEQWFSALGRLKSFEMFSYKLFDYPSLTPAADSRDRGFMWTPNSLCLFAGLKTRWPRAPSSGTFLSTAPKGAIP